MSFVGRARSSVERGDTLRAVITLVAGLRRTPDRQDALDYLVELVRDEVESGGIEHEIAQVLAPHPHRDQLLTQMVLGLRARDQDKIADRLIAEAAKRHIRFIEPEPEPELEPEPEAELEVEGDGKVVSDEIAASSPEERDDPAAPDEASEEVETQSGEDDGRRLESAEAESRLSARKREVIEQRQAARVAKRRRQTTMLIGVGLIVGIALVGIYGVAAASRTAALHDVDEQLQSLDRFDTDGLKTVVDATRSRDDAVFAERLAFARAVSGDDVEVRLDRWETQWGLAASAIAGIANDDIETALAIVTKAERTHAGGLGTDYARALLEERRGNADEARAAATRVIDRYPKFPPAHEVVLRIATRQLEFDAMRAASDRLRAIAPEHPYARLGELPHPRDLLLGPVPDLAAAASPVSAADDFLTACAAYQRAAAAVSAEQPAGVVTHSRAAVAADPQFLPARLLLATALAHGGDAKQAEAEFRTAAAEVHSAPVRVLLQSVAPIALSGAGRPDLAAAFTTPYPKLRGEGVDDRFDEEVGGRRPASMRKSALTDLAVVSWGEEALFARVAVLAASGHYQLAEAMLTDLRTRNLAPGRASVMLQLLRVQRVRPPDAGAVDAPESDALTAMVNDFAAGRFRATVVEPPDQREWAKPTMMRLRAQSMMTLGRVWEALAALETASVGLAYRVGLDGLRLVARARLAPGNVAFTALRDARANADPISSVALLDYAEAQIWQRQLTDAQKWLDRARKIDPDSRRAAWVCGTLAVARDRTEEAEACFSAAGFSAENAGLLLALGFMQLEFNRPQKARSFFEAALAADASDADAARGLGAAVVASEGRRAQNLLEGVSSSYEVGTAVRAELDRWTAVAAGARDGEEAAFEQLDAAAKVLGPRPDLMLERARYHTSREEWDTARQLYESAVRRDANLAEAHLGVARSILRNEEADDAARPHLERYLELEPTGAASAWVRRQLE